MIWSLLPRRLSFDHEEGVVAPVRLLEKVWITMNKFRIKSLSHPTIERKMQRKKITKEHGNTDTHADYETKLFYA